MSTPVFDSIDVPTSRQSDSNTAGAPLPIIPRRGGSSSRLNTVKASTSPKFTPSPVQITLQQATPPDDDTVPSSSTGTSHRRVSSSSDPSRLSPTSPHSKARPLLKISPTPSEPVTPTPAFRNARSKKEGHAAFPSVSGSSSSSDEAPEGRKEITDDTTPRPSSTMPFAKRTTEATFPRTLSESHVYHPGLLSLPHSKATPKPPETPIAPIIIRKKSGQPVKSSLKSSCRSPFTGTISLSLGNAPSKSEPTTPTVPKAVKFDARLNT
ncbi:hypothetical protein MPER_06528 [Moniliophthora perniciosa FA553]|nr:hypothetical protein MPER_06528 [Moniliophthora perniciosa FA553]